jgi:hypothetical protein
VLGDDDRVVAGKGAAGERLVEAGPQAEVAPGVDLPAQGLLRRHVGHGAHHHAGLGHAGQVQRHRQAEVAQFGVALPAEPDVARLDVAVDDAPVVGVLEGLGNLGGYLEALVDGKPVVRGLVYEILHRAALHELGDDVGLSRFLADVVDGDHIGVVAQTAHRLGLAADTGQAGCVQALGLDQGEGHVAVEPGVVGQADPLLAALAQERFTW